MVRAASRLARAVRDQPGDRGGDGGRVRDLGAPVGKSPVAPTDRSPRPQTEDHLAVAWLGRQLILGDAPLPPSFTLDGQTLPVVAHDLDVALDQHAAPSKGGRHLKIFYGTQARSEPPTFVMHVNDPKLVHFTYKRFLENRIREAYGFLGTPIRLVFKPRRD